MLASQWKNLEACLSRFDYLLQEESQSIVHADIAALEAGHQKKQGCLADIEDELQHLAPDPRPTQCTVISEWPAALQNKYQTIVQRLQQNLELAEQQRDMLRQVLDQFDQRLDRVTSYSSNRDREETITVVDVEL